MPWPQPEPDYFACVILAMLLHALSTFSLLSHIVLLIEWLLMSFGLCGTLVLNDFHRAVC